MAVRSTGTDDLEGPIAEQEEVVHRRLQAAEEAVERWGSRGGSDAWGGGVFDFPELAAAVRELISLSSDGGSSGQRAKMALEAAMVHLEDEFRQVLISGTYFIPPDSLKASLHDSIALPARSFSFSSFPNLEALSISSLTATTDDSRTYCSGFTIDSVSMEKVHLYLIDPEVSILLKEIAELIILAGHAPNLCHVYSETRHNTLMQCLCLLGVPSEHAATAEDGYNMQPDSHKVKLWIQGLKIFFGTVFPEERRACAHIFGCNSMVEKDCFTRATIGCIKQLFVIGSAIAKTKNQDYEKVPLLLEMYDELAKLQPISQQDQWCDDANDVISQEASTHLGKLGEAALGLLLDFLSLQFKYDLDEKTALDGNILSLTQFVMGFAKVLAEYNGSLNLILPLEEEEAEDGTERTSMSPWARYVLRLLSHLQLRVVDKSEFYKDQRLRYIFLMNNAMHVLEHSNSSVLRMSLRDNQTHGKLVQLVEEYATAYLRATWFPALFHLKGIPSRDMIREVKEGFKNFNSAIEDITRFQTTWKVPNPQLRQHLRIIILNLAVPAYHTYLGRYSAYFCDNSKYIKYIPNDIENIVLDLFEG